MTTKKEEEALKGEMESQPDEAKEIKDRGITLSKEKVDVTTAGAPVDDAPHPVLDEALNMEGEALGGPVEPKNKVKVVDGRAVNAEAHDGQTVVHDAPNYVEPEEEDQPEPVEAEAKDSK